MPGAPNMLAGRSIADRSAAQVVWLFIVLPVVAGVGILCHVAWLVAWLVAVEGGRFTAVDGFWQVGLYGLLGLGVVTALPAAGYQELRRRKRLQDVSAGRSRPG